MPRVDLWCFHGEVTGIKLGRKFKVRVNAMLVKLI